MQRGQQLVDASMKKLGLIVSSTRPSRIGPKTAATLLETFGDLEGILTRTDEIKQKKRRERLETEAEAARISRRRVFARPLGSSVGCSAAVIRPSPWDRMCVAVSSAQCTRR